LKNIDRVLTFLIWGAREGGLIPQLASVLQINPKKKTDARSTAALTELGD